MDIPLRPEVLRWTRERARLDVETLAKRLGTSPSRVGSWESDGRIRPKQVEKLANATHTAVGLLYLPEPPVETLPVADFRTLRDEEMRTPSPDLLDVIDQARQRQDWFRDHLISTGEYPLDWVGSLRTDIPIGVAAEAYDPRRWRSWSRRRVDATVAVVDRVVQVFRGFEEADRVDDQFYADLAPQARLDMLLELVERHRSALGEAADRFERVHCITELSQH